MNADFERYAYALALFALGVAILGHGVAATVFVEGVTPTTVALPLVGSAVAYRSFVGLLPAESSLSADGFLVLLAGLTAGFVNLVGPVVYRSANGSLGAATPPSYWGALVVGVAGFAALGVYELLADRASERYALAKLFSAVLVATGVAVLLVSPHQPFAGVESARAVAGVESATAFPAVAHGVPAIAGAVVAVALFDYTAIRDAGSGSMTETASE